MNKKVIAVAGLATVGIVGSSAYLVAPAFAGTSSNSPAASSSANPSKAAHKGHKGLHRRAIVGLHGEATVKTKKGFSEVAWEKGRVTGTGSTLTVRSQDGTTWQWTLGKNARVRIDGKKGSVTQLTSNEYVVVVGTVSGGTHTAKAIVVPKKTPAGA